VPQWQDDVMLATPQTGHAGCEISLAKEEALWAQLTKPTHTQ
jgi:hypothetical protein